MRNGMWAIQTTEVQLTIGTMGKKDAKQEHYQVKEVKKKRRTDCAMKRSVSSDKRSAECGASGSERMKLFV